MTVTSVIYDRTRDLRQGHVRSGQTTFIDVIII